MHVPHGILYTVGNISDVLYGISPRYKNVPHGISPTVYKTYIPWGYAVGHNLYTVGNVNFDIPWGTHLYAVGKSRFNDVKVILFLI